MYEEYKEYLRMYRNRKKKPMTYLQYVMLRNRASKPIAVQQSINFEGVLHAIR
jgi:hypothetical protein